jgi:hypothetical protein
VSEPSRPVVFEDERSRGYGDVQYLGTAVRAKNVPVWIGKGRLEVEKACPGGLKCSFQQIWLDSFGIARHRYWDQSRAACHR